MGGWVGGMVQMGSNHKISNGVAFYIYISKLKSFLKVLLLWIAKCFAILDS
jgi:hypothetical protein